MKNYRKLFCLLLAAALMMSLAASAAASPATKDVTLVLDWTPNTNHTGIYVALAKGYYEDAGLRVNIIQPPEDGATMMVASGKAEFGIDFQDYLTPVFASRDHIPVTAVAALIQHNTSGIISLKEDGIESPRDLEGKNYATWELPTEQAMLKNINGGCVVNFRVYPGMKTKVIKAYPVGTKVKVLEKGENWCKVEIEGKLGYVSTYMLKF